MDLFKYRHKNVEPVKKDVNLTLHDVIKPTDFIDDIIKNEPKAPVTEDIDKKVEDTIKALRSEIANRSITLNPLFDYDLIDSVYIFENLLRRYIPALPSYVKASEDTIEVSLGILLAAKDFVANEDQIDPFDYVEDFAPNIPYEVFDLGFGFSINSFGSIYYKDSRLASCRSFNKIFVNYIDFKNYIVSLRIASESSLRNVSLNVPFDVLGLYKDDLRSLLSDAIVNDIVNVADDITVQDIIDAGTSKTDNAIENDLRKFITSKTVLNAEIITNSNAKTKDFIYLLLLLILGGGSIGSAPLPASNNKCATYKKPERKSIPNSPTSRPSFGIYITKPSGCAAESINTYHSKMWSSNAPLGTKYSILGLVYSLFSIYYDLNLSNIFFSARCHLKIKHVCDITLFDVNFKLIPGFAVGAYAEKILLNLQVWCSKQINEFYKITKTVRLPKLTDDGYGFTFNGYEEVSYGTSEFIDSSGRTPYEVLQIDLILRVNFARIFEFVYNEKLYSVGVNSATTTSNILDKVVEIYKNKTTYKLTNMNKAFVLSKSVAKTFYDRGYQYIYGDNLPDDSYTLKFDNIEDVKNQTIKTILQNELTVLDECSPVDLKLELFDGNSFTKTNFVYVYNL